MIEKNRGVAPPAIKFSLRTGETSWPSPVRLAEQFKLISPAFFERYSVDLVAECRRRYSLLAPSSIGSLVWLPLLQ